MRISDIIRSKGSSIAIAAPSTTISEVVQVLSKWGVGAIVVSDDGTHIDGILSERDIVRSLAKGEDTMALEARQLMTTEVVTRPPDATVDSLMELMTERRIRHVPVVDDGELIGIVSIGDVVKTRVGELEREAKQLHDYISTGR
jgi:CBS domain-containing protein